MTFNGRFADHARLEIPVNGKMERVRQIVRKHDGQVLWQKKCINMVPISTETDGETIYNEIGYKNHVVKYVSNDTETSTYGVVTTGYFPAKADDVISIKGVNWQDGISYNVVGAYKGVNNASTNMLGSFAQPEYMNCWYDNAYVNQLPTAKDTDGTIYNGIGYKRGIRYTSGTAYKTDANCYVSGIIEVQNYDVIYLRNITMNKNAGAGYCNILYYTESGGWALSSPINEGTLVHKFDEDGNLVYFQIPRWGNPGEPGRMSKIRIQCSHIDINSIVSINAPANKDIEFTNLIPLAINPDGTPYVGDNGEKGYKTNYYLSYSGQEASSSDFCCTGFIPIRHYKDIFYFYLFNDYNIGFKTYEGIFLYDANFTLMNRVLFTDLYAQKDRLNDFLSEGLTFISNGQLASWSAAVSSWWTIGSEVEKAAYFRVCAHTITDSSIIVAKEPISNGPGHTNWLANSIDENGNIFNGTGYKSEHYLNESGTEKPIGDQNVGNPVFITGFIPIRQGDIIRLKNCYFEGFNGTRKGKYGMSTWYFNALLYTDFPTAGGTSNYQYWPGLALPNGLAFDQVTNDYGFVTQFTVRRNNYKYMRLTLAPTHTPADAIITINEEIYEPGNFNIHLKKSLSSATHARISGYGDGRDLVVTVNEEITPLPPRREYYNNWIWHAVESDGRTPFNGGLGYKDGYRLVGQGEVIAQARHSITGYIPAKAGDYIRVKGIPWTKEETTVLCTFNTSFEILKAESSPGADTADITTTLEEDGTVTFYIKSYATETSYIRLSGPCNGANIVVTINEKFVPVPPVANYKNCVPYSTEADGVTIYNGGLGYMNGSRISSSDSGAVIKTSPYGATHTGFIPVKPGDVIRISGANFGADGTETAINTYDSTFTANGQTTLRNGDYGIFYNSSAAAYKYRLDVTLQHEKTGVWKWVVPPANSQDKFTVSYIRITARGYYTGDGGPRIPPGKRLIVTINEEIND